MSQSSKDMGSARSKTLKRVTNDENDPSLMKRSKSKKLYSFTPTTTPGFSKSRSKGPTAAAKVPEIAQLDINIPLHKSLKRTPRKRTNPDQNSDDHVYWEMTPSTNGQDQKRKTTFKKSSKNLPSSPIVSNKSETDIDPLIPFLKKYNTTLDNLTSQTPDSSKHRTDRRSSDPEISDLSRMAYQISPTVQRTKSAGLAAMAIDAPSSKLSFGLAASKSNKKPQLAQACTSTPTVKDFSVNSLSHTSSSGSNKDINKLLEAIGNSFKAPIYDKNKSELVLTDHDSNDKRDDDFDDEDLSSDLENISVLLNKPKPSDNNVIESKKLAEDFMEEGFSDDIDMSELDNLLSKKTQTDLKDDSKGVIPIHTETIIPDGFSSDEEMSDDEELDQMIIKLTQRPLTKTQDLVRSDRNNAAMFQNELKRTDTSNETSRKYKADTVNLAKSAIKKGNFHRYQILDIMKCKHIRNGRSLNQKILTVLSEDGATDKIIVRDLWETLDLSENDVIHIVGSNPKIVDHQNNMLIWNPDFMLSATAVGDALVCERKAVLNTRLSFPGDASVPLIVGNIVHTIFQSCLTKRDCTIALIAEMIEAQLETHLISILSINETKQSIKEEVIKHVPYIQTWISNFVSDSPKFAIPSQNSRNNSLISISNTLDIEEYIWSPMYGIRGLIDATVEAYVKDSKFDGRFVTPLEIKTGAVESLAHRAQTSLYTLLIKERYDIDSEFFLLLYSKLKEMKKHEINNVDLKLLINIRNRISKYLREDNRDLPPLLQQSKCDKCFALEACMTMNNLLEGGNAKSSGLKPGLYESITKEIDGNESYQRFFNYWDDLITKEESVINALKKELWVKTASEREANGGKAIGNLKITESLEEKSSFLYTLERTSTQESTSLQNSQLSKHDRVIISDENGHFALSSGWIVAIRPSFLTVRTDRRIINSFVKMPGFDKKNNQRFKSVLHSSNDSEGLVATQTKTRTYRVDKDEMFHGLALARYNLLNLFLPQVGDSLRRHILVDLKSPRFAERPLPYSIPPNMTFNSDQISAFNKVLKTQDFSLILGMPGTGKTTVIAQIIRFLVSNNMSVLLASYTHSAVDNILIKLLDDDMPILRTGYPSRVHPDVRKYVPNSGVEGSITIENNFDFKKAYIDARVVATTCLGINDVVFNHRKNFDYCIVDEASQVSMPVCLGPLRFANKFILVGDHYQLPPLVISPEAKKGGLDKSMFMTLSENFPESVVDLSYQYRMCADIMLLSNTLIYEGRLKCGNEKVANQDFRIPFPEKLQTLLKHQDIDETKQWMKPVLDPKNKVLFLNHDEMPAFERVVGEKVENVIEAELVRQVVQTLIYCGVDEKSIGVMSLYRAQLRLLYRKLTVCKGVEILTADQFQGRDKDCVIISMVRSNNHNSVGDLLKEWRRINVAITRARSKLIILGSQRTMKNLKTLEAFMSIIESRGWMYDLPKNSELFYNVFLEGDNSDTQSPKKLRQTLTTSSKLVQNRPIAKNIIDELIG